jgi:hypothetical protein
LLPGERNKEKKALVTCCLAAAEAASNRPEEHMRHIIGGVDDLPAPTMMAFLDGVSEIVLPILLIVGLATRLSALVSSS